MNGKVTLIGAVLGLGIQSTAFAAIINVPSGAATIQAAINLAAASGDEIVVAPGTWAGGFDFDGKALTLRSSGGAAATIISGTGLGASVITVDDGEGPALIIKGFTISGGTGTPSFPSSIGGGMFIQLASPTISDCIFKSNSAGSGGGIYFTGSATAKVTNCLFISNTASQGGAIYSDSSSPLLQNCTLAGNTGTSTAGGVHTLLNGFTSAPRLINCIVWGNTGASYTGRDPVVSYSDIQGGAPGGGTANINLNPLFVSLGSGNARLSPGSPAIDAGKSDQIASTHAKDLDGNPRGVDDPAIIDTGVHLFGIVVDMGAYERQVAAAPPSCPGDLNGDNVRNVTDLLQLISVWGACP